MQDHQVFGAPIFSTSPTSHALIGLSEHAAEMVEDKSILATTMLEDPILANKLREAK